MNKNKYSFKYPFYFLSAVLIIIIFISAYHLKQENSKSINFKIEKIDTTLSKKCYFYDKSGNKLNLKSYSFYTYLNIRIGDEIIKNSGENLLSIYREDSTGNNYLFLELKPDWYR